MANPEQIRYGIREFDLGEARENKRINVRAENIAILRADDTATLRINSTEAAGIDARELSGITVPDEEDGTPGIDRIYLSNDAGTGTLRLLIGFGGAAGSTDTPGGQEVDVTDRQAREIGKARIMDSGGVLVDPFDAADATAVSAEDSGTGTGGAAELDLGPLRQSANVHVDTSGAATLTVEVSADGGTTWLTFDQVDYSGAAEEVEAYPDVAFGDIRAYLDTNRNGVTIAAKGV